METRLQRYAKYRNSIRTLPEEAFTKDGKYSGSISRDEMRSLSAMGSSPTAIKTSSASRPEIDIAPEEGNVSPYSYYLRKKRTAWVLKAILSLLVIAGLVVFFIVFVGLDGR